MSAHCEITPISAFQSTNLSNKITSFNRLSDRILRSLGYPFVNVEIHRDQLYENISIACEMFSKFAGYTKEFLIFDSNLYVRDVGIKLDSLFSLKNSDSLADQARNKTSSPAFSNMVSNTTVYVCNSSVNSSFFTGISSLSATLSSGIVQNEIFSKGVYDEVVFHQPAVSGAFTQNYQRSITTAGTGSTTLPYNNAFDYDVMDYRKVISVTEFEQGSSTGINTLFTIEQTLAQQTYFSYAMGNYGFDLISWYVLKDWLDNREKLLATQPSYDFNDRTQILRLYPQPGAGTTTNRYYGVVSCYVEKPIRDIIQEHWVYQYSLALCKILVGRHRGKYTGTTLFGGGQLNADMIQEGLQEKEKLEQMLYEGASPGMGDCSPATFIIG